MDTEARRPNLAAGKQLAVPEVREQWELENDEAILEFYEAISSLIDGAAEAIGIPANETWTSILDSDIEKREILLTFPYGSSDGRLSIYQRKPKEKERLAPDTIGVDFEFLAGMSIRKYSAGCGLYQISRGIAVHYSPYDFRMAKKHFMVGEKPTDSRTRFV